MREEASVSDYKYPLPMPDVDSAGFWDGTKQHELRIQQCSACKRYRHPPRKACPSCHSEESQWVPLSGKGKIYGWIEVFQPVLPMWRENIPYNIVEVELDDAPGVIITGNVPEAGENQLTVGMPVEVFFDDVTSDVTMPRWRTR